MPSSPSIPTLPATRFIPLSSFRARGARASFALVLALLTSPLAHAAENQSALARLRGDMEFLAADRLEGRDVGTSGLGEAASLIRDRFREIGLKSGVPDGSYFQLFKVKIGSKVDETTELVLTAPDGSEILLERGKDYQPLVYGGEGDFDAEIVFAGFGISAKDLDYDDYADLNVKDKVVLIMRREPQINRDTSPFNGKELTKYAEIGTKMRAAWKRNVKGILLVSDPASTAETGKDELLAPEYLPGASSAGVPICHITQEVANRLLANSPLQTLENASQKIDEALEPQSAPLAGWKAQGKIELSRLEAETPNVVGILEGEGPLADETIIVGAHFDHVGMGGINSRNPTLRAIHNGADDNASGTTALLELARRYAERPEKPPRRMLFIAFSGEERGLLGSRHYVRKDPLVALDKTAAMVNFDMVGRLRDGKLILYGTKTAEGLEEIVTALDEADDAISVRSIALGAAASDHISFYQANVPALHFFTGMHPEYHLPTDDIETINFEGLLLTVNFAEQLIDKLLVMPTKPVYVKVEEKDPHAGMQLTGNQNAVYLGTSPDYGDEYDGVLLDGVRPGSPADKGGLKAGDLIVEFGGEKIKNVQGYTAALYSKKPDDQVKVVVLRGDKREKVELTVTLGRRGETSQ